MKKTLFVAGALTVLLATPAAAAEAGGKAGAPPQKTEAGSRLLDLGRWLDERLRKLAAPFPASDPERTPRGPRYDNSQLPVCDPERSHCPIG